MTVMGTPSGANLVLQIVPYGPLSAFAMIPNIKATTSENPYRTLLKESLKSPEPHWRYLALM